MDMRISSLQINIRLGVVVDFLLDEFQSKSNAKLIEGEAEEFLSLLDEGVVILDKDLKITYVNKKALSLFHNNRNINKKILSLCEKLALLTYKKKKSCKKIIRDQHLENIFEISSILRQKESGVFLIFKDKTSEYNVMKVGKDFVANASHELRTPLTVIKGYSETLNEISKLDDVTIKQIINKIITTSLRLENIIYDLLLLADIENINSSSFRKIDIIPIIKNVKAMLLQIHRDIDIKLDLPDFEIKVFCDAGLIEIAIKNLLENAVKYSKDKVYINVTLNVKNNYINLAIEDRGIGISKKDIPYIFNRFFTVDKARSRKQGGTGLGLSLVKNILDKHSSSISVLSREGKGSTFQISVPM